MLCSPGGDPQCWTPQPYGWGRGGDAIKAGRGGSGKGEQRRRGRWRFEHLQLASSTFVWGGKGSIKAGLIPTQRMQRPAPCHSRDALVRQVTSEAGTGGYGPVGENGMPVPPLTVAAVCPRDTHIQFAADNLDGALHLE